MANTAKKVPTKKLQITFTERMIEMIEQLQDVQGLPSMSAAIHSAISEVHGKRFPAYTRPSAISPSDRLRTKEEQLRERDSLIVEEKKSIVEELGGEIFEKNGTLFVRYYTYNFKKRYEQEYTLEMVNADLVKNQYTPSKEKVLALQAEGKVDYKIEN